MVSDGDKPGINGVETIRRENIYLFSEKKSALLQIFNFGRGGDLKIFRTMDFSAFFIVMLPLQL